MSANSVLVVEDDPSFSAFVGEVAKAHGFEAEILEDGELFCERYSQRPPVLVILDLNVPGLDGIEMLRWLSQSASSSLILLISGVDPRVLRSALRLGSDLGLKMVGALPKPVELVDLEAVFDRCGAQGAVLSHAYLAGVLERDELRVVFQPKIELATGRVCGWEALSRWSHPVRGTLSPNEFVPWFEQEGLHVELVESVVRALGRELPRSGAEDGAGAPSVALNLTPLALDDLALPDRLASFVSRMGLDPTVLTIEVTETAAMREPRKAADILARLRLKGFKLALDDFGAGHSSLAWLHRFPVSELKIDQAFMRDLIEDSDAQAIVSSIVRLGHELGVVVCAEGVENYATHAWLRQLGCDRGQGFLYARPLPSDEIASWLSNGPRPWYESPSREIAPRGLRPI